VKAGLGREEIRRVPPVPAGDEAVRGRAEIDADDIILLYRQLGFTTVDEGLDPVEQAYPGRPILAKVKFLLTEIVDSMQD
jgi:hypothetical protein